MLNSKTSKNNLLLAGLVITTLGVSVAAFNTIDNKIDKPVNKSATVIVNEKTGEVLNVKSGHKKDIPVINKSNVENTDTSTKSATVAIDEKTGEILDIK